MSEALAREIAFATGEHVLITLVAMAFAVGIGIPLAIWCARGRAGSRWLLRAVDVIQTVPSLALLGFLIPIPLIGGIGMRSAIVALTLYSLLPIVRGTVVGLREVDAAAREAGIAMGMTSRQLLREVEIPLAMPSIVAGIRVATVIAIGVATIAAAIGAGGLGTFIFRGVAMVDSRLILAGAIPAALLALLADMGFARAEARLRK